MTASERVRLEEEERQWVLSLLDKPQEPKPATKQEIEYFVSLVK